MNKYKTNLSLIMDILEVSTPRLMEAVKVDKTQVSRWRSGARRILVGSSHGEALADFFLGKDDANQEEIKHVLKENYPLGFDGEGGIKEALMGWLSLPDQDEPEKTKKRTKFYYTYMAEKVDGMHVSKLTANEDHVDDQQGNHEKLPLKSVTGFLESRAVLSDAVEYLAGASEPADIIFVCPEGIDIITADESFSMTFLNNLTNMLKKGNKLNVVLRTDFKMSEVASFAGPWLVAHLTGYIKSWYYDDFRKIETDKILVWVDGKFGIRISGDEYNCQIVTDPDLVAEIGEKCKEYKANSVQRFLYNYFEEPDGYLKGVIPRLDGDTYLYQRMPNVCIGGTDYLDEIGVTKEEQALLTEQFPPLMFEPGDFEKDVYYMLCIDDLEDALDKPRYLHFGMEKILGRRIYVDTQILVNQLVRLKKLNKIHKNFHICFMKNDVFEQLVMEIGVWEWKCAMGWIKGVQSTATNDNFNTLTLHGFCATVWGKIPGLFKSRAAANRTLSKLLGRAKKFGYDV